MTEPTPPPDPADPPDPANPSDPPDPLGRTDPTDSAAPDHPRPSPDLPRLPLPRLLEAVLGVGSDLEVRATLQRIVENAAALTGARYAALSVLAPGGSGLAEFCTAGLAAAERARIERPPSGRRGLLGALVHESAPLRLTDLTADPRSCGFPPGHPRMRSFLGVPLFVEDEVYGNLYLTEKRGGPFTDEDEQMARLLAAQAGIAIGNARLYETARQRERWIEGAAAVTTALLTGEAAADALMTVAERARVLADASAGVILQPTDEGGMEIVTASAPAGRGGLIGTTIAPGSAVLEQLLGGEPVFLDDSATDARMTTPVRHRFGPSMMLPLQAGGRLIGTLALPRRRGDPPYSPAEKLLATQFASQAALALVLADARQRRERLAVFEDRDRIARDLHDLVVQRLFATGMMLESTQRRTAAEEREAEVHATIGRALDELRSTVQEVRTTIFALQQPPADAPTSFRGKVLRETAGAAAALGVQPSVQFTGPVDTRVPDAVAGQLLTALRAALATASHRAGTTRIGVTVDATVSLPDGRPGVRLTVSDNGTPAPATAAPGQEGTTTTWQAPL
ncbi:histidine kinase [Streptomyces tauricus]|uniref:GAF domain-containing protein n=1 Tax=Streptomyces tauricus TaxID=68274 RepID=UPI00167A95CC|nr:GAF domain-containing protein [Streptomyces tauricus]MCW8099120.1 GAF domain-containing protein [Streptomyces tauricus]GHA47702.1 histidine kinase [Streptomyces tauricus]